MEWREFNSIEEWELYNKAAIMKQCRQINTFHRNVNNQNTGRMIHLECPTFRGRRDKGMVAHCNLTNNFKTLLKHSSFTKICGFLCPPHTTPRHGHNFITYQYVLGAFLTKSNFAMTDVLFCFIISIIYSITSLWKPQVCWMKFIVLYLEQHESTKLFSFFSMEKNHFSTNILRIKLQLSHG